MAGDRSKSVMARRIAVATLSIVIGWPMCVAAAEGGMGPIARAALFVAGCVVLVLGLRPHIGVGLLLAALAVLGGAEPNVLEHFTAWTATFAVLGTLGFGLLLGLRSKYSLLLMSLPWWGLGDAAGWAVYVAIAFTFAWMASLLQPLLSGHGPKVNRVVGPDPRLARGPLVEVPQREFGFHRGRRVIRVLLIITTIGCAVGTVLWIAVGEPVGPAITIPSASFAVAFWASELSSRGIRFRVDEKGLHAEFFLRRTSIRSVRDWRNRHRPNDSRYAVQRRHMEVLLHSRRGSPDRLPGKHGRS